MKGKEVEGRVVTNWNLFTYNCFELLYEMVFSILHKANIIMLSVLFVFAADGSPHLLVTRSVTAGEASYWQNAVVDSVQCQALPQHYWTTASPPNPLYIQMYRRH